MLRALLIALSKAAWARRIVMDWGPARRAASRFISGEKLDDAINAIKELNRKGIRATLDHLGENTTNLQESHHATADILSAIDAIDNSGVQANISIKLTQIGLALGTDACSENLMKILSYARDRQLFVRIDMEDSSTVDRTLGLWTQMRSAGFTNTGVVIQAYLHRSAKDVDEILGEGGYIRLCKGAYKEHGSVAIQKKSDVDNNYDQLTEKLIDGALIHSSPPVSSDGKTPPIPAIATHDPARLVFAKACAEKKGLPQNAIEFQMLYGIRQDLQEQCVREGYPVRIYVPYGTEWYPFYVRRLAESPANLWFFISNFFRR